MDWKTIVFIYCAVMIHAGMGWVAPQPGEHGVSQSPYGPSFISKWTCLPLLEGREKETFIKRWAQQVREQSSSEMPKAPEDPAPPKKPKKKVRWDEQTLVQKPEKPGLKDPDMEAFWQELNKESPFKKERKIKAWDVKKMAKKDQRELDLALLTKEMLTLEDRKAREDAYFSTDIQGKSQKTKGKKAAKKEGLTDVPHFTWEDYPADGISTVDGLHPFQEQGILRSQGLRYIINPGMDREKWTEDGNFKDILNEGVPLLWKKGILEKKPYQDMKRKIESLRSAGDAQDQAFLNVLLAVMLRKREQDIRVELTGWAYDGGKVSLV